MLVEAGASVTAENYYGRTPWQLVAVSRWGGQWQRGDLERTLFVAGGNDRLALGMPIFEGTPPIDDAEVVEPLEAPLASSNGGSSSGGTSSHRQPSVRANSAAVLMQAPPGATAGERLLVRTFQGSEFEFELPQSVTSASQSPSQLFAVRPPLSASSDGQSDAEGLHSFGPSFGRPVGRPLPTMDHLAVEVVALQAPGAANRRVDELASWLTDVLLVPKDKAYERALMLVAPTVQTANDGGAAEIAMLASSKGAARGVTMGVLLEKPTAKAPLTETRHAMAPSASPVRV